MCPGNGTETKDNIVIEWMTNGETNKLKYSFSMTEKKVKIDVIDITIILDEENFPNATESKYNCIKSYRQVFYASLHSYLECKYHY